MDERSPPSSPTYPYSRSWYSASTERTGTFQSVRFGPAAQAISCDILLRDLPDRVSTRRDNIPDPSAPELSDRFLCRPCFIINGGSKGDCPVCRRPVLALKSEGGFVETSGRVWHKKCFSCEECQKNIGDTPMLFEAKQHAKEVSSSLSSEKADNRTPVPLFKDSKSREGSPTINELEQRLGIMKSREGSPVLEELTQRLNAVLNRPSRDSFSSPSFSTSQSNKDDRESSPLVQRILEKKKSAASIPSHHGIDPVDILTDPDSIGEMKTTTPFQATPTDRPSRDCAPPSTRPSFDAIEEMKNRIMNQVTSSPVTTDATSSPGLLSNSMNSSVSTPSRIPRMSRLSGSPGLRLAVSTSSLWSSRISRTPSTPDLIPDISDTLTQSSGPSSPPTCSPHVHPRDDFSSNLREHTPAKAVALDRPASGMVTPKPRDSLNKSSIPTATLSSGSLCAKCGGSLFATGGSGRFVTVPELNANGPPKTYHTECFRCALCDGPFKETANGQAVFVRGEGGACHIEVS
ncbi:hypothetical protein JVT61DRAFT_5670 [Boletus reticuloceps]|uniref:LIM zinc-binding domain-containing protein n=1 Tax=Boletus reticuloceps TaxID=495285 RepID=A0A8I2YYW1_9AGAM|nr:hypothetical protein JVT61DRAFT_5670 [Boletus reticuloceps]